MKSNFDASIWSHSTTIHTTCPAALLEAERPHQRFLAIFSQVKHDRSQYCFAKQSAADQSTVAPQTLKSLKQMQPSEKGAWIRISMVDSKLSFLISAGVSFFLCKNEMMSGAAFMPPACINSEKDVKGCERSERYWNVRSQIGGTFSVTKCLLPRWRLPRLLCSRAR